MYYMLDKDTKDTQALVIKTPRIFIPHSLYARGGNQTNQYLEIVFLNEGGDPMLAALKKWIKRAEARVIKILSRRKTIKLDDKDFAATNPGVWCHSLHELTRRETFTDWTQYKNDSTFK